MLHLCKYSLPARLPCPEFCEAKLRKVKLAGKEAGYMGS
jgi:hypothetical protein